MLYRPKPKPTPKRPTISVQSRYNSTGKLFNLPGKAKLKKGSFSISDTTPPNRPDIVRSLKNFLQKQKSSKGSIGDSPHGNGMFDNKSLLSNESDA